MKKILKNIFKSFIKTVGIKQFIFTLFCGILLSFIIFLEPIVFIQIIKKLESFYSTGVFDKEGFIWLLIFWALFVVFSNISQFLYYYFLVYKPTIQNYAENIYRYGEKIIHMPYSDYLSKKQGSIFKIYDRGCDKQEKFFYFFFKEFILNISGILFVVGVLLYIDPVMTLITLSMLPIMLFIGFFSIFRLRRYQDELNDKRENIFGKVGDILNSFSLTKVLGLERIFKKDIYNELYDINKKQFFLMKGWSFISVQTSLLVMIGRLGVLGFGAFFVTKGELSFAMLFLFFSYVGWIYFPLGVVFSYLRELTEQLTSIGKMYDEFDNLEDDLQGNQGKNIKKINGNISFEDVSFGYNEGITILKKLSFEVKAGKKIAFVGNTGAGKSTIVNLLFRFWDIDNGKITLDGLNINEISKTSLRQHIGVVTQDNTLFNTTIKENLLYAKKNATKKELEDAIKKAEAHFVFELKDGINTVIGERGLKLSGGEKQRISIARLFLKNPKILVLDEATSALDNRTEKLIQKALDKLMKGRTSIIIAHRLSTIQNADTIFMLEKGKIVETGNYTELMNKKSKFYKLANPDNLILN